MKYFGEFLVEKNILSADQLVKAVLKQTSTQPLAAQVSYDTRLLSAQELMQVFSFQQTHQVDFIAAGEATGLLTKEKKERLTRELHEFQIPLAKILMDDQIAQPKDLIHAMDEYLAVAQVQVQIKDQVPHPGQAVAQPLMTEPQVNLPSTKEASSPSKSLTSAMEFTKIGPSFVQEFKDVLSEKKVTEMINILNLIQQNANNKDLATSFLQDILKNIHVIRGLAKASKSLVMESLCSLMDKAVVDQLKKIDTENSMDSIAADLSKRLIPSLITGLHFCQALAQSVAIHQTEETFYKNMTQNEEFSRFQKLLGESF